MATNLTVVVVTSQNTNNGHNLFLIGYENSISRKITTFVHMFIAAKHLNINTKY